MTYLENSEVQSNKEIYKALEGKSEVLDHIL